MDTYQNLPHPLERDVIEHDMEAEGTQAPVHGRSETVEPIPAPKPSQAEGDRDTILEDIADKEGGETF